MKHGDLMFALAWRKSHAHSCAWCTCIASPTPTPTKGAKLVLSTLVPDRCLCIHSDVLHSAGACLPAAAISLCVDAHGGLVLDPEAEEEQVGHVAAQFQPYNIS